MLNRAPEYLVDLDRAINRLDFYRLFKALCVEFDLDILLLLDMNSWPEEPQIDSLMVVLNSDDHTDRELDSIMAEPSNEMFESLRSSMLIKNWDLEAQDSDPGFYGSSKGHCAVTAPMHTPLGRHFGFWMLAKADKINNHPPEFIKYSLDLVFERFHEKIILPTTLPIISPRELEVIRWSSEGKTSVEIAIILGLSEHTINSYTTKILQKLQVVNRAQMVAKSLRMGLIQ